MKNVAIHQCIDEGYGLIKIFTEKIRIPSRKLWRVCNHIILKQINQDQSQGRCLVWCMVWSLFSRYFLISVQAMSLPINVYLWHTIPSNCHNYVICKCSTTHQNLLVTFATTLTNQGNKSNKLGTFIKHVHIECKISINCKYCYKLNNLKSNQHSHLSASTLNNQHAL